MGVHSVYNGLKTAENLSNVSSPFKIRTCYLAACTVAPFTGRKAGNIWFSLHLVPNVTCDMNCVVNGCFFASKFHISMWNGELGSTICEQIESIYIVPYLYSVFGQPCQTRSNHSVYAAHHSVFLQIHLSNIISEKFNALPSLF